MGGPLEWKSTDWDSDVLFVIGFMTLSNHFIFCVSVSLSIKGGKAWLRLLDFMKLRSIKILIPKKNDYLKIAPKRVNILSSKIINGTCLVIIYLIVRKINVYEIVLSKIFAILKLFRQLLIFSDGKISKTFSYFKLYYKVRLIKTV